MRRLSFLSVVVLAAAFAGTTLADSYVYVDPGDWSGARSTSDGTLIADGNQAVGGYLLTWDITQNNGMLTYIYRFYRAPLPDDQFLVASDGPSVDRKLALELEPVQISHFNLETSLNFPGAGVIPHDQGQSNPTQPSDLFGLKFEEQDDIYQAVLVTDRLPVWGDVYGKKGTGGFYNTAFGTDPTAQTTDFSGWVATPDTITTHNIPTPAAAGAGLILLGLIGVRRKRA